MRHVEYGEMELRKKLQKLIPNQSEFSRQTGIPQTTISEWRSGKREPTLKNASHLARALGVPLDYLADDGLDEPPPPPRPETSEEERVILRFLRATGLDTDEALRRLSAPSVMRGVDSGNQRLIRSGSVGTVRDPIDKTQEDPAIIVPNPRATRKP
jgi:transcriptional regulator with XRE-family HTH domain